MSIQAVQPFLVDKKNVYDRNSVDAEIINAVSLSMSETTSSSEDNWLERDAKLVGLIKSSDSSQDDDSILSFSKVKVSKAILALYTSAFTKSNDEDIAVLKKYSDMKSFDGTLTSDYNKAMKALNDSIQDQYIDARNTLSKLKKEQEALKIELNSGYDRNTGGTLSSSAKSDLQKQIDEYTQKITAQRVIVNNLAQTLSKSK